MDKLLGLLKLDFLQGYRTYVIVAMMILAVVVEKGAGIDVPGIEVADDWFMWILGALGLGTARAKYADGQ